MRISDWSSDVCSSDLLDLFFTTFLPKWPGPGATALEYSRFLEQFIAAKHCIVERQSMVHENPRVDLRVSADPATRLHELKRAEERRVGKECVRTCRSRCQSYLDKKNNDTTTQK